MGTDRDTLLRIFETAVTIQIIDDKVRSYIMSGAIQTAWHSPRGQEIVASATGACLQPQDYVVTNYRGLHDQIAKGIPLRPLLAESLGRVTGANKGRGGPRHVVHPQCGLMLTTTIVGGGLPIANGLALASKLRNDGRVTVCNFGEGAANIGAFHEALNLAGVWALPVIFLCQNNGYAESTRHEVACAIEKVSERASSYGIPGTTVDGDDPVAMYEAACTAVERARAGSGPTLIEAMTHRLQGHYVGDTMSYVPHQELEAQLKADPVPRFHSWLIDQGHATEEVLKAIEEDVNASIADAFDYAFSSEHPDPADLLCGVYAQGGRRT
jgi:pyruvate dehydrogenase E1 component alpha subunit